jgi:hypothetical protein
MGRSRGGDAMDVAGAVKVIELTCTDPRVWNGRTPDNPPKCLIPDFTMRIKKFWVILWYSYPDFASGLG